MEAAPVGGFGLDRTKRRGALLPAPKKPLGATEHTEQRRDCLVSMSVSVMSKSVVPWQEGLKKLGCGSSLAQQERAQKPTQRVSSRIGWSTSQGRRLLCHCETGSSLCHSRVTHGAGGREGKRQDLATWAVSHSGRFSSPRHSPGPMWHVVKLFGKGLQSLSLSGYLLNSNRPYPLIRAAYRAWHVRFSPAPAAQMMVSRLQRKQCWWDWEPPAPFPPAAVRPARPQKPAISAWDRTSLPHRMAKPGLWFTSGTTSLGTAVMAPISCSLPYPIFKVPILTTRIKQFAQQLLVCCSLQTNTSRCFWLVPLKIGLYPLVMRALENATFLLVNSFSITICCS